MTKIRPRHAAPSRASKVAGRAALGGLGASMAMLAVASPAMAAPSADVDARVTGDDAALDTQLTKGDTALPGLDALGVGGLTGALPTDGLPVDGLAFEGIDLELLGHAVSTPALPAADGLPALPSATDLTGLPVVGDLTALHEGLPSLPGGVPSLPSASGVVDTVTAALPEGLPSVGGLSDLDSLTDLPSLPTGAPQLSITDDLGLPEGLPELPAVENLGSLPAASDVLSLAGSHDLRNGMALDLDDQDVDLDDQGVDVDDEDDEDLEASGDASAGSNVFSASTLVSGVLKA